MTDEKCIQTVRKSEGKRPFGSPRCGKESDVKMVLREVGVKLG